MHKVVGINLNGRAYHVEDAGYEALRAYLEGAAARLAENPDRVEILADLEQAIAEKCDRLLGPHTTVVAAAEVDRILAEMGPVDAGTGDTAAGQAGGGRSADAKETTASPKRLYQIREGSMISGLCTGIAAYLFAWNRGIAALYAFSAACFAIVAVSPLLPRWALRRVEGRINAPPWIMQGDGADRIFSAPQVPTLREVIPAYERPAAWMGYFGPAGLPQPITRRLHAEIVKAMNSLETITVFDKLGLGIEVSESPEAFAQQIKRQLAQAGALVKSANIEPE